MLSQFWHQFSRNFKECLDRQPYPMSMRPPLRRHSQSGYTLIISVVFTIGFASVLGLVATADNQNNYERRVYSIAWQLNEISKAARLYVRNNSIAQHMVDSNADGIPDIAASVATSTGLGGGVDDGVIDNLYERTNLAAMAAVDREITVDDLIVAGYLPTGFGRVNGIGQHVTALNQRIRIFADLSPIGGAVDPTNTTTVSTAYLVVEDSPRADATDVVLISQALQVLGTTVTAPLFNGSANISDNCVGTPAVAIWDTGCLNEGDYQTIIGAADTFDNGDFVIPAWKAAPHDERALMRFPQPENFGYATMLTDLYMGACSADPLLVNTAGDGTSTLPVEVDSGVCRPVSDNPGLNEDNRRSIFNIASLAAQRMIAADQRDRGSVGVGFRDVQVVFDGTTAGGIRTNAETAFTTDTLDIDGIGSNLNPDDVLVFSSLDITGDLQIFDDTDFDYTEENNFSRGYHAGNNIQVAERVFLSNPSAAVADLADAVISGSLDAPNMDLRTDTFFADNAGLVTTAGIDTDTQNPIGTDTNDINSGTVNIAGDIIIDAGLLDGLAGSTGLTTEQLNAAGADMNVQNANILGEVRAGTLTIDGTDITNPDLSAATTAGNINLDSGISGVTTSTATIEGVLTSNGTANFTGVTDIEFCSGDCPDLLDDPGPLFP